LRRESVISVPTLTLHGSEDGATTPQSSEHKEHLFSGPYHRVLMAGIGHFPQRENPAGVVDALLAWLQRG
jgi:pimeloyl-ACP methyl ester carboxylesterase